MLEEAYSCTVDDVLKHYNTNTETGLTKKQIESSLKEYGYNGLFFLKIDILLELPPEENKPLWKLVLEQFDDLLVKILLLAAVISFVIHHDVFLQFHFRSWPGLKIAKMRLLRLSSQLS